MDQKVVEAEQTAYGAVGYWEGFVRWIGGPRAIGASTAGPTEIAATRLSLTALTHSETGTRFWLPTQGMTFSASKAVDATLWERIQRAFDSGQRPPLWFKYLDDSFQRIDDWDTRGAIISIAIACELLAREAFWVAAGQPNNGAVRELLDRTSVRAIVDKWTAITGIPAKTSDVAAVKEVAKHRNRVMHAGTEPPLDTKSAAALLRRAQQFILSGDAWLFNARGITNPRLDPLPPPE